MSLRSANIALGRLERGVPAAERAALRDRAREALDAADARIAVDDPDRSKWRAAERRYRRLRAALEGARHSSAAYRPRKPRQARLP